MPRRGPAFRLGAKPGTVAALACALVAIMAPSCKKRRAAPAASAHQLTTQAAPIALPVLGVESPSQFNYRYDAGTPLYRRAQAAYKQQPRDWAAVEQHCRAALAKDARHLEAARLLATALAQRSAFAEATDVLLSVLEADWLRFGPNLTNDAELAPLFATPHGEALRSVNLRMQKEFTRVVRNGPWVLGRRSRYREPAKNGPHSNTTRGEVYALDLEHRRWLRLTHTEHQVAAVVRANDEFTIVGYDRVDIPPDAPPIDLHARPASEQPVRDDASAAPATIPGGTAARGATGAQGDATADRSPGDAPAHGTAQATQAPGPTARFVRAYLQRYDAHSLQPASQRLVLRDIDQIAITPPPVRIGLWSGATDIAWSQLAPPATPYRTADRPLAGTPAAANKALPTLSLHVLPTPPSQWWWLTPTQVGLHIDVAAYGIEFTPAVSTQPNASAALRAKQVAQLALPAPLEIARASLQLAPDASRLAIASTLDPCGEEPATLFVATMEAQPTPRGSASAPPSLIGFGAPQKVASARSTFASTWIDDHTLLYDDGAGALHVWDALRQQETAVLSEPAGVGLSVLAPFALPPCISAPTMPVNEAEIEIEPNEAEIQMP